MRQVRLSEAGDAGYMSSVLESAVELVPISRMNPVPQRAVFVAANFDPRA